MHSYVKIREIFLKNLCEENLVMQKLRKILFIILILIVLLLGVFMFAKPEILKFTTNKTSEISLIQDEIVELSEWTTLKYDYSNVIISRTEKSITLPGIIDIDFAKAIKLIAYSGYLKAGTDLSKIEISYDETSKKLLVKVPKSKILDNVVETEKTTVEDIKGNIFSDYPTQIVFDEINAAKKQLEEEKINQGFLEEADKRINILLSSFLDNYSFEDVVITFY